MAHLQYMPGDPRLVDQLVYELKSKGIFDQFRKECIADVDTRPAYQNLRQRVESSVASFLSRQCWKPDLNKNQLREKLRKHLLDGNYLEQGVERIVDQVVNPKVASVFIPQVEDVVYNYLGIPRKKAVATETSNGKNENDLLPTDLEAVSPGSVKSNDDKNDAMDTTDVKDDKMDVDEPKDVKDDQGIETDDKEKVEEASSIIEIISPESESIDKSTIPLPTEEIKLENIPAPENSPPNIKNKKIDLEKIDLPKEPNLSTDIPLPDEMPKIEAGTYFKPITLQSEDDDSSSDSSLRRNMSPLTPIRNFNNENSCDAQQAFENDSDSKSDDKKEPSTFRFTIESKSSDNSSDKPEMKPPSPEQQNLSYQFNQVNINTFNTPLYDDSSNSHNLQIDYESDVNSKMTVDTKLPEAENSTDSKKEKKDDKKSHKSSHRSRDSHRHSSSKDKGSESKHSSSRDSSRHDKKPKDDKSKSSKEKSSDKDRKDSRDSSKHRSSHKSSSHKDSKSHRSSSSSKHSSRTDDKKSSSKDKDKSSDKSSKDRSSSKSSSHRSDKDRKSSKSKSDEKENKEKKEKKETDDHYSLSGRGNPNRRSTDRDSNDGSSSSKGSQHPSSTKSSESKKENKSSSKSENTSTSDSTSPSDNNVVVNEAKTVTQVKPVVRVDTHLETPFSSPPRLPFVPDVTLKKPRFAANMEEAKRMIKMRKFLEEEQKRMNQEAALLLEFQANVRPSLSQVYSSIPGPELEFACVSNVDPTAEDKEIKNQVETNTIKDVVKIEENMVENKVKSEEPNDLIAQTLIAMHQGDIVKDNDGNAQENVDSGIKENINVNEDKESLIHTLVNNDNENSVEEDKKCEIVEEVTQSQNEKTDPEVDLQDEKKKDFEITIITEEILETEEMKHEIDNPEKIIFEEVNQECPEENLFKYFAEHEKYNAELERDQFDNFLKTYTEKTLQKKLYLINCDSYEENVIREASHNFGNFEIVNYYKNGHLKLSTANKNIVKDVNVTTEITLPTKTIDYVNSVNTSPVFSPVKSECSFELSSDYDAKLEEMVNKTSRQEIMEIILGNVDESPSKMPRIDYCTDSNIDHETNVEINAEMETENVLKRKLFEMEGTVNNNRNILTANKIRKLSGSDQITSTTEETEDNPNNNRVNNTRSKYLGKARRVGLPRPKKTTLPNSPSSDKSVENYEQNAETSLNGKIKRTVQRYDTSDLYKPKLHYLSRRNNIS